uniref:Protein phosphatase 1 regulatory subunit 12B n=4 Tax=Lygus hesperus TaxID=30085 RepID=A0A146M082_LYGHE
MSCDTRSSALFKRAEQIKRWEESETNREPPNADSRDRKIKFSAGCVFLAACKAGDKDEILRLLKKNADIDTTDVDGLSALHQACIDDNLDLVEFLVEHGADVNKGDNEGWTPLHATASCGFISIAKYLIENGANVAAVNNDGELPVDVAESDEMEDMLQQQIDDRGIDAENARTEEERMMLNDAKVWLANGYITPDKVHPKTGATPLHVAAAKGYLKVMDMLLKAGADPDAQDLDGWTPLHAASHWGQKEACEVLIENLCDMDIKNCVGQTAVDVAENEIIRVLEELRKKQAAIPNKDNIINRRKNIQKKSPPAQEIISDKSEKDKKEIEIEEPLTKPKVPEVPQVKLEIQPEPAQNQSTVDKKNRVNENRLPITAEINKTVPNITPAPSVPPKAVPENDDSLPSWRRPGSFRNRITETPTKTGLTLKLSEKDSPPSPTRPSQPREKPHETAQEVRLRRTQSFEADEKFYQRYLELRAKIAGNSLSALPATPMRSASLKEKHFARRSQSRDESRLSGLSTAANTQVTNSSPTSASPPTAPVRSSAPVTPTTPTTPGGSKLSPANIFKNFFKSFVPPVRDEESETQRKAHAKRVRETRRSTQGVTLEEIKSAEQLVKKKQQQQLQQATQQLSNEPSDEVVVNVRAAPVPPPPPTTSPPEVPSTIKDDSNGFNSLGERRPSWRLKVDNTNKFMLEDARKANEGASDTVVRKTAYATPVTETGDTTVTLPLRKKTDDKESDKDNDSRTAQATQAAIQRRRRPKRRSTGVVHVDMDEIDPDRQSDAQAAGDTDDSLSLNNSESGGEQSEASSRLNSVSVEDESNTRQPQPTTENGEIDYKKLWEESQAENAVLREKLRCTENELSDAKRSERGTSQVRSGMSDAEKREKRAMERKLSEMEEELKQLEQLKCDNQRLKDENGALIRVISKLSK